MFESRAARRQEAVKVELVSRMSALAANTFWRERPQVFGDADCANVGNLEHVDVQACKLHCLRNVNVCRAVNAHAGLQLCTLRQCQPGATPSVEAEGFVSFQLVDPALSDAH